MQYYYGNDIYAHATNPFHFEITKRYARWLGVKHKYIEDDYESCLKLGCPSKLLVMCGENGFDETMKSLNEVYADHNNVYLTQNLSGWFIEILSTNKGEGFMQLCDSLSIKREESIGFGDGPNDVELVEKAGLGVAMKNAVDVVKAVADKESKWSNEEVSQMFANVIISSTLISLT